jgi:hypothetical protein
LRDHAPTYSDAASHVQVRRDRHFEGTVGIEDPRIIGVTFPDIALVDGERGVRHTCVERGAVKTSGARFSRWPGA